VATIFFRPGADGIGGGSGKPVKSSAEKMRRAILFSAANFSRAALAAASTSAQRSARRFFGSVSKLAEESASTTRLTQRTAFRKYFRSASGNFGAPPVSFFSVSSGQSRTVNSPSLADSSRNRRSRDLMSSNPPLATTCN
jgi:hypothetical protein